ncbi:hypothetical protein [Kribbella speibonae]|uniref:DUF5666 domain-containing protein n=1 Tax=Kribbella speibonae TaxID=1572660 RepID=A0ABY2A811_9ACTN|nr:hypothetical protein [Kribbella speibonae]TCC25218.1 hypothetical protein E0H58_13705 [Kribbella speibonae]
MALHQKLIDNRWRAAGTIAAVAATTVGGGVAFAATGDNTTPAPSTQPSEGSSNQKAPDHGKGPRDGLFGALHGEFVVQKDGGGYETVVTQSGSVTAVSSTSITVKSADGYTRTYVVNADTKVNRDGKIADVKTGATVRIRAVVSGSTATASSVDDGSNRPAGNPPNGAKPGSSESTPK